MSTKRDRWLIKKALKNPQIVVSVLIAKLALRWFENLIIKLDEIATEIVQTGLDRPQAKQFIMLVGLSLSGKTYLVEHNEFLSSLFRIESQDIHNRLNATFRLLRDSRTTRGSAYGARQELTQVVRRKIFHKIFTSNSGRSVVSDSCNLTKGDRASRIKLAKDHGYQTIIIRVQRNHGEILSCAEAKDSQLSEGGGKPTWVKLYWDQQALFEEPTQDEADSVLKFTSKFDEPGALQIV